MSADEVRRVELAKQIFDQIMSFDADSNGFIDASEFKAYLKAVGQWGTDELYTEERWEESWPTVRGRLFAQLATTSLCRVPSPHR
eukprot:COSAG05_NODE_4104_length_1672_cov_2.123967_2_plen_85_part_00